MLVVFFRTLAVRDGLLGLNLEGCRLYLARVSKRAIRPARLPMERNRQCAPHRISIAGLLVEHDLVIGQRDAQTCVQLALFDLLNQFGRATLRQRAVSVPVVGLLQFRVRLHHLLLLHEGVAFGAAHGGPGTPGIQRTEPLGKVILRGRCVSDRLQLLLGVVLMRLLVLDDEGDSVGRFRLP